MKKLLILATISLVVSFLPGCAGLGLQASKDLGGAIIKTAAFNAGCVGAMEKPEIFDHAKQLAEDGLKLIEAGKLPLADLVKDVTNALDIQFDNRLLQANVERFLKDIHITTGEIESARFEVIKESLREFIDGIERCGEPIKGNSY